MAIEVGISRPVRLGLRRHKSPCPVVACTDCEILVDFPPNVFCASKGHYVWDPSKKRPCCRWKPKGQTALTDKEPPKEAEAT